MNAATREGRQGHAMTSANRVRAGECAALVPNAV